MKFKINTNKVKRIIKKINFIKIDLSFFLILVIAYYLQEIPLYLSYVFFLLLHEFCHYFVAKKLGYMAKSIKLTFFGASLEGLDDFALGDEIKIILAGPLLNLIIIIMCYLSFWFYPESYNYLYNVLMANLSIMIFNLMPIYPLDLGRIILAILTKNNLRDRALKITKFISFTFILGLFIIFLFSFFLSYNFILGFVCVNLMSLHIKSSKNTSYKRELFVFHKAKLLKRGLIERNIYIMSGTPNYKLFRYIDDYHFINFIFLNKDLDVINSLSEIEFYKQNGYF